VLRRARVLSILSLIYASSAAWSATTEFSPPQSLGDAESSAVILEKEMDLPPSTKPATDQAAPSVVPAESKVTAAEKALTEDQIPVLQEKAKTAEAQDKMPIHKTIAALTIILILLGGLAIGSKKWLQKSTVTTKHTNIRVVTQHYLGSKKNLAIISVAGEYILIGVTDHNINLIKTLSLMDDEIPEQVQAPFSSALKSASQNEDSLPNFIEPGPQKAPQEDEEGFSIRNLKEVVSSKLKGMKEFS